jgi:hypothetical protein
MDIKASETGRGRGKGSVEACNAIAGHCNNLRMSAAPKRLGRKPNPMKLAHGHGRAGMGGGCETPVRKVRQAPHMSVSYGDQHP